MTPRVLRFGHMTRQTLDHFTLYDGPVELLVDGTKRAETRLAIQCEQTMLWAETAAGDATEPMPGSVEATGTVSSEAADAVWGVRAFTIRYPDGHEVDAFIPNGNRVKFSGPPRPEDELRSARQP